MFSSLSCGDKTLLIFAYLCIIPMGRWAAYHYGTVSLIYFLSLVSEFFIGIPNSSCMHSCNYVTFSARNSVTTFFSIPWRIAVSLACGQSRSCLLEIFHSEFWLQAIARWRCAVYMPM